ncbi:MAG: DegT/DnrJ/EryC1/StrS family aminotransferase [Magnetospirillum sp.]|nr:DegT/DnrJ/EryC1/StrS family aminotransferase [Magnetospirillum sp.]
MRIRLSEPTYGEEEIAEVLDSLRSTRVTMGAKCAAFEAAFANYVGTRHAVFVNSGSSANLLAWFAVANPLFPVPEGKRPWRPGAEVIVPAVTWSTTLWPIVQAGGVPVLVDCDPATLQMKPEAVEAAIGPDTVAVCPVHALGNSCDLTALEDICRRHGLIMMEDTCEALGTRYHGKVVGGFGLMGTYSFFFSHHITTIEGGMVVTDDDALADLLRCLRAHGWTRDLADKARWGAADGGLGSRFSFVNTGFNLRPSEINGAFGLHQLRKLEGFNAQRRHATQALLAQLEPLTASGDITIMGVTPGADPAFFGFPLLCRDNATRDGLAAHLDAAGIEIRPIICGNMARQPAMAHVRHRIAGSLHGADQIMDAGLYFGLHPGYSDDDVLFVAAAIREYFAA